MPDLPYITRLHFSKFLSLSGTQAAIPGHALDIITLHHNIQRQPVEYTTLEKGKLGDRTGEN